MLVELVVENYAVVERVRVRFHRGLNLLTGETGSGKSLVVDSLGLLFGGRASGDLVRSGAERARVSAIFEAPGTPEFRRLLDDNGIEIEDGELLVERELQASGKSRAFLGSRPVTVSLLRDLAPHLGDLHGQHDQQELFSGEGQRAMLDAFAGAEEQREKVTGLFAQWQGIQREMEELDRGEQEKLRMADLWGFQKREMEEANLKPGEAAELEAQRLVLQNVAKLEEHARAAYDLLYESENAAATTVRQARRRVEELCRIDPSLEETSELLKPAEVAIDDAGRALQHYLGTLEADPARLDRVEGRLAVLDKLKRKYGGSVEEMIAYLEEVRGKLAAVETAGERRMRLEQERSEAAAAYEREAAKLSQERRKAAGQLERGVEGELAALAMEGTTFRVELGAGEWSASGTDRVRFLVSPNRGEEARMLERVASGGELARLALALKTQIIARGGRSPGVARTLVFDEVDAGVGGRTAESVGRRLKKLAERYQVLCVTHLPQIAGFADHHFVVEKQEERGRVRATVEELTAEGRRREIGRMLSGEKMTAEALKHAEQLIKLASR